MSSSVISEETKQAPSAQDSLSWSYDYARLCWQLLSGAVVVAVVCHWRSPVHARDWMNIALLATLAAVVSLLPVRLPFGSIATAPVMPIIFVAAGLYGATAAILIDGCSMLLQLGVTVTSAGRRYMLRDFTTMIAVQVVATGLGALLYVALHRYLFPGEGLSVGETPRLRAWAALSVCTLLSFLLNAVLCTLLASRYFHRRFDVIWHDNVRWTLPSAALMSPIAFVMAVLYRDSPLLGLGFIIVPVYAARMATVYHERTLAAYKQGVELLGRVMQEAHPYTHGHLHRVARWAIKIAEEMHLPAESLQFIGDAAILHDIGKVAVDDRVLNKVGKLTDEDWAMIRKHPVTGAEIVARMSYMDKVAHWVRHHHERPDGGGYPDNLAGDDIPVESAIISVVDAFDAMVGGPAKEDQRPYRQPLSREAAIEELRRNSGTQFHPQTVTIFIDILMREWESESAEVGRRTQIGEDDSLWATPPSMSGATLLTAGGRA